HELQPAALPAGRVGRGARRPAPAHPGGRLARRDRTRGTGTQAPHDERVPPQPGRPGRRLELSALVWTPRAECPADATSRAPGGRHELNVRWTPRVSVRWTPRAERPADATSWGFEAGLGPMSVVAARMDPVTFFVAPMVRGAGRQARYDCLPLSFA